jgi:hypothetical protein
LSARKYISPEIVFARKPRQRIYFQPFRVKILAMKICPKCHSSYSDETLNFCLTDGVPLVVEEVMGERLSSAGGGQRSWQEAETLHDSRFSLPFTPPSVGASGVGGAAGQHTTSPNSSAPTFASSGSHTASLSGVIPPPSVAEPPKKSSRFVLLSVVGAALALGAITGGIWYFASGGRVGTNAVANQTQNSAQSGGGQGGGSSVTGIRKTAVALTAAQEEQVKKETAEMLEGWRSSIEKRDVETHIKNYVESLDNYYKESGIHREHVRADRQRAFDRYPSINLQIDNLKIEPLSSDTAVAVFDKSWTFKNPQRVSTGAVQQEMELVKQNGRWLIMGEKDAKVYYINNRDNPDAAAAAANSNAGQTQNQNQSANQ